MFGIDAKEIFQQKISDVIVILFAIHILAVTFMYVIKWTRPYLKYRAAVYNKHKPKFTSVGSETNLNSWFFDGWCKNQHNSISAFKNGENDMTDDEYLSLLGNFKAFVDIAENPSRAILDPSSLMKINMMSDSEFENALSLGNFLRKLNKRKCSSAAQTNITINPGLKVDYSCPQLGLCDLRTTDSSDSFFSACSKDSDKDLKELEQIIKEIENEGEKEPTDEDITLQKLQKYLKTSLAKSDVTESFRRRSNPISQDNKLLELAITEFEKELKPIKDQIQRLKECISGYNLARTPLPSDFTSSFSGSAMFTESCSGTSTCCSADLTSYFSSYHIISASSFGSMETDPRYKNIKKLDKIASLNPSKNKHKNNRCNKHSSVINKGSSNTPEVSNSPEIKSCKSSKRSPIAEMYVKLSQCNSHSSHLIKSKREKLTSSDNTVAYRIDLNVKLAGVPVSNSQKSKSIREREIQPLTSDPDEILGKPSNTHISLRSAVK